jgi:glyoxylase-like metal-dependent hydrolase (beta-lactamase superfamily II)
MIEIAKNIFLIPGENKSRFPYCACLYVKGKDLRLLIDGGMGQAGMEACRKKGIDLVILSHCHLDHRLTLARFPSPPIWCHEIEKVYLEDRNRFLEGVGFIRGGIEVDILFKGFTVPEFTIEKILIDGERLDLGGLTLEVLHTPGHTPGHLAFYIPEARLLFSADIDLTPFGPFYGHDFASIDDFIVSIRKLQRIDAKMVVTGHAGPFTADLQGVFKAYEAVVYERDQRLLEHLNQPRIFTDLLGGNLIYSTYPKPEKLMRWFERVHLEKQLRRLLEMGKVIERNGLLVRS